MCPSRCLVSVPNPIRSLPFHEGAGRRMRVSRHFRRQVNTIYHRRVGRPNFARTERAALCDLLVTVGPDAPTLCEGWTTRDLAAHLAVRDRRPDAAAGIVL